MSLNELENDETYINNQQGRHQTIRGDGDERSPSFFIKEHGFSDGNQGLNCEYDKNMFGNLEFADSILSPKGRDQLLQLYFPTVGDSDDYESSTMGTISRISSFDALQGYEESLISSNITSQNRTPVSFTENYYADLYANDVDITTGNIRPEVEPSTMDHSKLTTEPCENLDIFDNNYYKVLHLLEKQSIVINQDSSTKKVIPKKKKLNSYLNRHLRYALKIRPFLVSNLAPSDNRFRKGLDHILKQKMNLQLVLFLAKLDPKYHEKFRSFVWNKAFTEA